MNESCRLSRKINSLIYNRDDLIITPYDTRIVPNISVSDYIIRWQKYADINDDVLIIANIILDKYIKCTNNKITPNRIHRLLLAILLIASKIYEDISFSNSYYAYIGGVSLKEINFLEKSILEDLDWNVYVFNDEISKYYMS
jgi:hypothetical protein